MPKRSKFEGLLSVARGETGPQEPTKPSRARQAKPAEVQHANEPEFAEAELSLPRGRPKTGKRSNKNYTSTTVYIKLETLKRIKMMLLTKGGAQDFSELVESLLAQWLEREGEKQTKQ